MLDIEENTTRSSTGKSFPFQLVNAHSIVISRRKIIESGMARKDPIAIGVFASLVDLDATIHVPKAHGSVLRV